MLDTVALGRTGLEVSEIALGTSRFGAGPESGGATEEGAHDLLDQYVAAGGNFLDTADAYGNGRSERVIGEWLADRDREEVVLASKVGMDTARTSAGRSRRASTGSGPTTWTCCSSTAGTRPRPPRN
jgi:aryl-alcohol dehydrogenase-like predicted oxidoreductase